MCGLVPWFLVEFWRLLWGCTVYVNSGTEGDIVSPEILRWFGLA
jgi:hypothetical protein